MGLQRTCDVCTDPIPTGANAGAGTLVEVAGRRWHITPVRGRVDVCRRCLLQEIGKQAVGAEVIELPRRKDGSRGR